jgi:valyl-tRNA synthetase
VWNASRLIFSRIDVTQAAPAEPPIPESLEDRWIRSRLNACAAAANRAFEQHRYNDAANELWHFYWDEFCDWYLELKKPRFEENTAHLIDVYETALRLLHPLMPFLTEELWQRLQRPGKSIALQPYPRFDPAAEDKNAEHDMAHLQAIVTAARGLKAEHGIDGRQTLPGILYAPGHAYHVAHAHAASIRDLAKVELELRHEAAPKLEGAVRSTPDFDLVLEVPKVEVQRDRLEKENAQLRKVIASSERQLSSEDFLKKAPKDVVDSIRQKLADYKSQLKKNLDALGDAA